MSSTLTLGGAPADFINAGLYSTLQAAVNAAQLVGKALYIPPGTYNAASTPSFTGITISSDITVFGEPHNTVLSCDTTNTDAITITSANVTVKRLLIRTNTAGTGRGIFINPDGTGGLVHCNLEDIDIDATGSWGVYAGANEGDGVDVTVGLTMRNCVILGNASTTSGSLYYGSHNTVLNCYDCTFNGQNTAGTYDISSIAAGTRMTMGSVHLIRTVTANFFGCTFQADGNCTYLSMSGAQAVLLDGCYIEYNGTGRTRYTITTSGGVAGLTLKDLIVRANDNAAMKFLKTDATASQLKAASIIGGDFFVGKGSADTDQIVLGTATDQLTIFGVNSAYNGGEQALHVTTTNGGALGVSQTRLAYHNHYLAANRLPLMTAAQRDAIVSPRVGDMIYCTDQAAIDTTTGVLQVYSATGGGTWMRAW